MSKPKYCPIINIGRTEPTTRCLRGECEFWDEGFEQCYEVTKPNWEHADKSDQTV